MQLRMTRFLITALTMASFLAFAVASVATEGESKDAKIKRAMSAALPGISKDATIVDVDGTELRAGTNGWTCMPGLAPGDKSPACNDEVWMKLFQAMGAKKDFQTDRIGVSYMLAGESRPGSNTDPFDTKQDPGEVWVQEGPHLMIIAPDPKMLEGIPDDPDSGGPYVMWRGTPYVHVMVPVGPRPQKKN